MPAAESGPSTAATRADLLDGVLHALLREAPGVEAAAVVSPDGLPMASALPARMDEDHVAAMSAALLGLGDRAAAGLGRGDLTQVCVEGEHGTVILVEAGHDAVLVAVSGRHARIGLVAWEVRRAAAHVAEVLGAPVRVAPAEAPAASASPTRTLPVVAPAGPHLAVGSAEVVAPATAAEAPPVVPAQHVAPTTVPAPDPTVWMPSWATAEGAGEATAALPVAPDVQAWLPTAVESAPPLDELSWGASAVTAATHDGSTSTSSVPAPEPVPWTHVSEPAASAAASEPAAWTPVPEPAAWTPVPEPTAWTPPLEPAPLLQAQPQPQQQPQAQPQSQSPAEPESGWPLPRTGEWQSSAPVWESLTSEAAPEADAVWTAYEADWSALPPVPDPTVLPGGLR